MWTIALDLFSLARRSQRSKMYKMKIKFIPRMNVSIVLVLAHHKKVYFYLIPILSTSLGSLVCSVAACCPTEADVEESTPWPTWVRGQPRDQASAACHVTRRVPENSGQLWSDARSDYTDECIVLRPSPVRHWKFQCEFRNTHCILIGQIQGRRKPHVECCPILFVC